MLVPLVSSANYCNIDDVLVDTSSVGLLTIDYRSVLAVAELFVTRDLVIADTMRQRWLMRTRCAYESSTDD